jgi:hypothetical protein
MFSPKNDLLPSNFLKDLPQQLSLSRSIFIFQLLREDFSAIVESAQPITRFHRVRSLAAASGPPREDISFGATSSV